METQKFKTLESVMNLAKERDFYKNKCEKLEAELTEFYKVREFINSINSGSYTYNGEDDVIPFEDTFDTLDLNLQGNSDIVEFDTTIPTTDELPEVPDFTMFLKDKKETEEEEKIEINPNDNGVDEDLLNEVLAEVGITQTEEAPTEQVTKEEVETAPKMIKEIVQSKNTIELLDRKRKEFDSPSNIEGYIQKVLENYSPTKTQFGEENPLMKDLKSEYSVLSKALKRDSLKFLKDRLGIEEGFKVSTQYRLSVMRALKDINCILKYQEEPLSSKHGKFDLDEEKESLKVIKTTQDIDSNEAQEIEDTESKKRERATNPQTDLEGKIIAFYEEESIKDTKDRDLKLFEEMTEEQLKDRFITDVNFQINALKNGWNIYHFKSAKELNLDDVVPALIGDELLSKMNLDLELLKLLN